MSPNYESALRSSERVNWTLDAVLQADAAFDFRRDFLPEALVRAEALPFLSRAERRTLNQIRAHGYLVTFGLVEEFILPFVLDRITARAAAEMDELRALLGFANEEAKHIALFRRFQARFEQGFGHPCPVIGPPTAVRDHVLAHGELGVGLLILHIEWMTQQHYVEMIHHAQDLEPNFRRLLHQHWLEESQHARIDGWIVDTLIDSSTPAERRRGFEDYVALLDFLDQGLGQQVDFDLATLQGAIGRSFTPDQVASFIEVQRGAQRNTYLGCGVRHPRVRAAVERMLPTATADLDRLGQRYH